MGKTPLTQDIAAFDALIRKFLQLPPDGTKQDLIRALKSHGELTPAWYQNRISAIEASGRRSGRASRAN